ncbi:MAG: MoxR family ATPase [Francisellaceae bacterium]|jgi:MoxR-like ATPase|nr:MoxR family ATPase [Francisellaceae bacterium]MBT6207596.1 MoxR family ATPase [Francisellaceae bacterium]MBT6539720.1 MoxR family ATPase [Francisellaceae bacterium]
MLFEKEHEQINLAITQICKRVIGQRQLIENLFTCLLCKGHALIEGAPGLAKTTAAKLLANSIHSKFHRIQFTPDLLPSDLIGSDIFIHQEGKFSFRQGPIFQNIVLADEINRAPAKVQSALLESMEEKQVTVGNSTYKLEELFMVIATQNPIEQEGTYPLPEAQLDRFLMQIWVDYPSSKDELEILNLHEKNVTTIVPALLTSDTVLSAQKLIDKIYIDESLKEYIVSLVQATRHPEQYTDELKDLLRFGASPRATLALVKAAKANAWLQGQDYVSPANIQVIAPNILRHRIIPSFEAEASGISKQDIVSKILTHVAIP